MEIRFTQGSVLRVSYFALNFLQNFAINNFSNQLVKVRLGVQIRISINQRVTGVPRIVII